MGVKKEEARMIPRVCLGSLVANDGLETQEIQEQGFREENGN